MRCHGELLRNAWRALLAVVVLGVLPVAAEAAGIGFRNETDQTIYVQGHTVINAKMTKGSLLTIPPGKALSDSNLMKGLRHITITDGGGRVLFSEKLFTDGVNDQFFGVVPVPAPKGAPPRVDLKPRPLPPMP